MALMNEAKTYIFFITEFKFHIWSFSDLATPIIISLNRVILLFQG